MSESTPGDRPEERRRLTDKIVLAFDLAEQQGDLPVAELLSQAIEVIVTQNAARGHVERRGEVATMADVHSRLLAMRQKA